MEIEKILKEQRNFFETGATKSIQFRQNALNRLEIIIKKHEREIADALKKDLHKSAFESYMTEIGLLLNEIRYVKKHLASWMKEKRVPTPLAQFPAKKYGNCGALWCGFKLLHRGIIRFCFVFSHLLMQFQEETVA